jgi:regulator of protease activity HflC (stomatin/prohibitin superfamily)
MSIGLPFGVGLAAFVVIVYLAMCIKIIKEYQRGVLFFLGRYTAIKDPGLRFVLVPFFRIVIVDLRTYVEDVPPQDVITLDNVSSKVNAVIYYRVIHPDKAVLEVEEFRWATSQLAQTTLRSVVGAHELDALLSEREKLNDMIQEIMDDRTDPWGVKVSSVEIKHVEVPQEMRRVMARQAEAERERRAKVIAAEGEHQAAAKLSDAAEVLATQPGTIQLRYLQTLVEIAAENNSTTVFPIPLEYLEAFTRRPTGGEQGPLPPPPITRKEAPAKHEGQEKREGREKNENHKESHKESADHDKSEGPTSDTAHRDGSSS